jgi:hypothetical protein
VVAIEEACRPSFNAVQNGSAGATIVQDVFDAMVLGGRKVTAVVDLRLGELRQRVGPWPALIIAAMQVVRWWSCTAYLRKSAQERTVLRRRKAYRGNSLMLWLPSNQIGRFLKGWYALNWRFEASLAGGSQFLDTVE